MSLQDQIRVEEETLGRLIMWDMEYRFADQNHFMRLVNSHKNNIKLLKEKYESTRNKSPGTLSEGSSEIRTSVAENTNRIIEEDSGNIDT